MIKHLQNAAKGDRLSLEVWATLLERYQAKHDTAKTIETFAEMLRVAPTNQKLREEANRFFIKAGQPQKAEEIAREGIQLDPSNPDFLDLLGNACLLQEKPGTMKVEFKGRLKPGVFAKDAIMRLIALIGVGGANGPEAQDGMMVSELRVEG